MSTEIEQKSNEQNSHKLVEGKDTNEKLVNNITNVSTERLDPIKLALQQLDLLSGECYGLAVKHLEVINDYKKLGNKIAKTKQDILASID